METIEQLETKRGLRREWQKLWIRHLSEMAFIMPIVFAFVLYSSDIDEAIFWAVISLIGFDIYKSRP